MFIIATASIVEIFTIVVNATACHPATDLQQVDALRLIRSHGSEAFGPIRTDFRLPCGFFLRSDSPSSF